MLSPLAEKDLLEATYQMHSMMLGAVETITKDETLLRLFNINKDLWYAIKYSWDQKKQDLLGRFDWSWDGSEPPKVLEYNADTPSLLLESDRIQGTWFATKFGEQNDKWQSNYI